MAACVLLRLAEQVLIVVAFPQRRSTFRDYPTTLINSLDWDTLSVLFK